MAREPFGSRHKQPPSSSFASSFLPLQPLPIVMTENMKQVETHDARNTKDAEPSANPPSYEYATGGQSPVNKNHNGAAASAAPKLGPSIPYASPSAPLAGPSGSNVYSYQHPVSGHVITTPLPPDHPEMICLQAGSHIRSTRFGLLGVLAAVFWFPLGIGRDSRASPLERRKRSRKLNPAQKKLFRKLLNVLGEIIDDKGHFSTDDDAISAILEDTDAESESEEKKGVYIEDAREASRQPPFLQGDKANEMKEASKETKNILHFRELCESHGQLTGQIRGSLNALGGGGRTAKALERMHTTIDDIKACFVVDGEKIQRLDPSIFKASLDACHVAASEVMMAFKELGVYNKVLFDILGKIMEQLQVFVYHLTPIMSLIIILGRGPLTSFAGAYRTCCADQYLDDVFEPLVKYFDSFINELTNIADKEIAAIRQAQDFRSQRYLNLTTVATFLSSVTVSTLQITADDGVSSLASVTNTLWLISLVFSTASAVYSLLMMTWRQSSVCQPNLALPSFLDLWFRNGPMYALIVAVMTFSIGSCLLAFHIADEQGVLVSAIVPTAFAGIHAYGIFIFSVWFLLEQWKDKHTESWRRINDIYLGPFKESVKYGAEMIKEYGGQATTQIKEMRVAARNWCTTLWRRRVVLPSVDAAEPDIEPGVVFDSFNALDPESLFPTSEGKGDESDVPESVHTDTVQAIPEGIPDAAEEEAKYNPFESLLHFSPDGFLLACAHGNNVTIYEVEDKFNVLTIITTPLGDQVKQISWNPGTYGYRYWQKLNDLTSDLLVRSSESVSSWSIRRSESTKFESSLLGVLKEAVLFVRWTGIEDAGVEGFVCASNTTVRLFSAKCEELRSFEIARMREISRISHALLFRNRYLICLTDDRDNSFDCLLIVDSRTDAVQRFVPDRFYRPSAELTQEHYRSTCAVRLGHSSMSVSSDSKKILLHGSDAGVQIAELSISESGEDLSITEDYLLWDRTYFDEEMTQPEGTAAFHGADDKMIIGYSANEVVVLYRWPYNFSALHIFSTPTTDAILEIPMSFTVNRGPESDPYMLAFSDKCGSVMIWSIQSNNQLSECPSARSFTVHDRRNGRQQDPTIRTGKFLLLNPPTSS
ncbi:hypothetical protein ACEPAI_8159 [Sanghuangporus weigelae]